jgi:hypothetical protein
MRRTILSIVVTVGGTLVAGILFWGIQPIAAGEDFATDGNRSFCGMMHERDCDTSRFEYIQWIANMDALGLQPYRQELGNGQSCMVQGMCSGHWLIGAWKGVKSVLHFEFYRDRVGRQIDDGTSS